MLAVLQVLGVAHEDLFQVRPTLNAVGRKVLQPCSCQVSQEQGEIADDEVITDRTVVLASEPVVLEPQARVHFPEVLWDISRWAVSGWERRLEDTPTESLGPHWFEAMSSVLLTVVVPTMVRVVAMAGPLPCIIVGTLTGVDGVTRVTVAVETFLHRNCDAWPIVVRRLVD